MPWIDLERKGIIYRTQICNIVGYWQIPKEDGKSGVYIKMVGEDRTSDFPISFEDLKKLIAENGGN